MTWLSFLKLGALVLSAVLGTAACRRAPDRFSPGGNPGETFYFVPARERVAAMTFDDGPSAPATEQILNSLRRESVMATFFLVGQNAERHPGLVRRIRDEGHELGAHSYAHLRFDQVPAAEMEADIVKGVRAVEAIAGAELRWFRPPFGINGPGMDEVCRREGLSIVGWSGDANDWNPHAVDDLVRRVVSQAVPGMILLLHDGWETRAEADRLRTAAAVPLIVRELKARGYRLVGLSELLRLGGPPAAVFANGIRLLGVQVPDSEIPPGDAAWARFFWEFPAHWAGPAPIGFAHVIDRAGRIVTQADHELRLPRDVRDREVRRALTIPPGTRAGRYAMRVGVVDPDRPGVLSRVRPVRSLFQCKGRAVVIPDAVRVGRNIEPG